MIFQVIHFRWWISQTSAAPVSKHRWFRQVFLSVSFRATWKKSVRFGTSNKMVEVWDVSFLNKMHPKRGREDLMKLTRCVFRHFFKAFNIGKVTVNRMEGLQEIYTNTVIDQITYARVSRMSKDLTRLEDFLMIIHVLMKQISEQMRHSECVAWKLCFFPTKHMCWLDSCINSQAWQISPVMIDQLSNWPLLGLETGRWQVDRGSRTAKWPDDRSARGPQRLGEDEMTMSEVSGMLMGITVTLLSHPDFYPKP